MNDLNKAVELIHKLLALARDGGATEAEAALAMAKAQEKMAEHNLTMATFEASGGKAEGRTKQREDENLLYAWKRDLLERVAKVNYCHLFILHKRTAAGQKIGGGYEIIGRESNVVATKNMFSYLLATIERLVVAEVGTSPQERYNKWSHSFRTGCADRLKDRLQERFDDAIKEQSRKAREANAASRHPNAATGNALVVVMEDYHQTELDLNNDLVNGWAPGTTAAKRVKREAEYEAFRVKLEAILAANPGIPYELARYMASGWDRDRAEQVLELGKYAPVEKPKRPETERQRQKREERDERARARYQDQEWRRQSKTDWSAYHKGQTRADDIGLDQQVDKASRRGIG